MEARSEFQTALKKTVVMFNTLTGKSLTQLEGEVFINLFDMAEGYLATSIQDGTATMQVAVDDQGGIKVREVSQEEWRELEEVAQDVDAGRVELTPYIRRTPRDEPAPKPVCAVSATVISDKPARWGIDAAWDEANPYTPPAITTSQRDHIQGYDWQIVVLSREKDETDSYIVNFAHKPTQKQFAEHYVKLQQGTHYVYVNEWIEHDWKPIINRLRASFGEIHAPQATALPDERWEHDDMAYRVRYFGLSDGELRFLYLKSKPTGAELAKYHHTKGFAVVQSKVG